MSPMYDHSSPALDFAAITPSDTVNLAVKARGIYVGGAGDVVAINGAGLPVTFSANVAGTVLPIETIRINARASCSGALLPIIPPVSC